MSIEVRPLGVKCNLQCLYCYQHSERNAGNILHSYNIDKIKACIEKANGNFTLFGGEALLMPEKDLEELWSWGLEHYGRNGIQTNGDLIDENHVRLFKKYKVNIGISIDGPGELNNARWNGTLEKTREATKKTHEIIERLCKENLIPSIIVTLHRRNATKDKLSEMNNWFRYLDNLGIEYLRLHLLEVETNITRENLSLSDEENITALLNFYELSKELNTVKIDIFKDIFNMLLGQDKNITCCWTGCDAYTTPAVQGIEGNGQSSNCTRVNKEGIDFTKPDVQGFERYIALYHTPQEYKGCQGCRFFLMCRGHCPGTAVDKDWRNRTEHCEIWKELFMHFEKEMLDKNEMPLSMSSHRKIIEEYIVCGWANGLKLFVADILNMIKQNNSLPMIEKMVAEYKKINCTK